MSIWLKNQESSFIKFKANRLLSFEQYLVSSYIANIVIETTSCLNELYSNIHWKKLTERPNSKSELHVGPDSIEVVGLCCGWLKLLDWVTGINKNTSPSQISAFLCFKPTELQKAQKCARVAPYRTIFLRQQQVMNKQGQLLY